jgi:hypothetical protein
MQLGLQKVFSIRAYDYVTDEPKMTLKFLKDVTFENMGEVTNLTQNGTPITSVDHSRACTLSGSSAVIDETLMSLQLGKDLEVLTSTTEIRIQQTITTTVANEATISYAPAGVVGAEIKFAELVDADGNVIKKFTQMTGTATTLKFTYATKKLTFFTGEVPIGSRIRVSYYPTIASARKIQNLANKMSATVRIECDAVFNDACSSQERIGLIVMPKAKFSANFSWATAEAGDFAVHDFSLTAQKTCDTEKLWDMYTYNVSDIQA